MDFTLSTEQTLLRDSARRFLGGRAAGPGPLWPEFADLGWLALSLPESHDGMAPAPVEVAILAEALGRHGVVAPWVACAVLAAGLLADTGTARQLDEFLPGLAAGTLLVALAHTEPHAHGILHHVATSARRCGDVWVLDGVKTTICAGDSGTHFLVSARSGHTVRDRDGIALFIIPRDLPGLTITAHRGIDGAALATLGLQGAIVGPSALLADNAFPAIERSVDRALAAWCAEAVGAMDLLLAATIAYTTTRVQFGRPIAANQAIRHRLADIAVAVEEARSLTLKATLSLAAEDEVRGLAVAAAKVKVGRGGRFVAEQAVQLHGAMGVTDELNIGSTLKRLLTLDLLFGSAEDHLRRHVALTAARRAACERPS